MCKAHCVDFAIHIQLAEYIHSSTFRVNTRNKSTIFVRPSLIENAILSHLSCSNTIHYLLL